MIQLLGPAFAPPMSMDAEVTPPRDEPMTAAQRSDLEVLCRDTDEEFDETITQAEASELIEILRSESSALAED